ncbi:amidohydrolase [Nordella sp. HKS 07]|uniref:M20 aminoacylase family protein n=1 Tax=Nordella sp. HKS 07 TaxID=2712222 RepID=UPI0013E19A10|nr:M20 aminoacylase family protein [Nordella sp. HKS 07]QIG49085.1 amidohydrolase [Nordella sp. HKS 07]
MADKIDDVADWRRALHQMPEPGFEEIKTSRFVATKLRDFGLEVHDGIGGTGVIGVLRQGTGNRCIALRADMDALKITERTGLPHASRHDGVMHACGHDGHTAMLLGAARELAQRKDFSGSIVFLFQPAEEHGKGAQAMIDDGLLERFPFDEIYGLHNLPGTPVGRFATRAGPLMACEDNFEIRLTGKGGHAARPHTSNDPIVIAAHLVLALQAIVSRRADPLDNAVVSVTEILTDGIRNVLPERVTLRGDTRSYLPAVQAMIEREMRKIAGGIADAFGAEVDVDYSHEFSSTVNHAAETDHALAAAQAALGAQSIEPEPMPMMGSEDFGLFLKHRPGNFAFLGNGTEGAHGLPLHNARYDFNDAALGPGIAFWTTLARQRLPLTD